MRALALCTAAALVMAAGPSLAAGANLKSGPNSGQVTVHLGDLDLGATDGARAAVGRLARAAAEACAQQADVSPGLLRLSDAYRRCRIATLQTAVSKIHTSAMATAAVQLARR
jgi:UrcA family protein